MAKSHLTFISTLHGTPAVLILVTTAATHGLTPITTIRPTINLMLPKADLLHLPRHLHAIFWGPTRILGNTRIARFLVTLSNGTYPHPHPHPRASTDTSRDAPVHIAISYPVITALCSTCTVTKACTVGETRTHGYMPPSLHSSYYSPSGPSSMFASVPPRGIHPDTHLNHRWPAEPRQGHQPMAEDDSDVEYETITAEEACQIRQDDIYAKLPKAFRRTTSDGKLKKQTIALKGPGSSLCEPRPSALETYRLSSGNGNGFAPGGFQGFLPRKLRRW